MTFYFLSTVLLGSQNWRTRKDPCAFAAWSLETIQMGWMSECPSDQVRAGFQRISVCWWSSCSGVFPREQPSPWLATWKICSRSPFASSHCDLLRGGILIRKSLSSRKNGKWAQLRKSFVLKEMPVSPSNCWVHEGEQSPLRFWRIGPGMRWKDVIDTSPYARHFPAHCSFAGYAHGRIERMPQLTLKDLSTEAQ